MKYLKSIENRLNDDKKDILKHIFKPVVVATPLSDSRRNVCILPDGEIRSYGKLYVERFPCYKQGKVAYLSSKDCGLSWEINYSHGKMNSCTYIENGDIYITSCDSVNNYEGAETGLYVYRSKIGPDDPEPEVIKLCDERYIDAFLPVQSKFSSRVWFTAQHNGGPVFFYSDDYGINWEKREIINPNKFTPVFPHKGARWCIKSGTEPQVVELSKDNLLMIIRTPMDCFYKSYSYDGGDNWTIPEPTDFYGTNTTAYMLRLSDGRIVAFWNNTKPLPQPNLKNMPDVSERIVAGMGEYGFTNRDAAHVAISDDGGKTFKGYREVLLNPIRNNEDFRYIGGVKDSADKSVHQFQAYELPFNKVLVSIGQNIVSRRLVIFDLDWLYETSSKEDFMLGTGNVTTHTYLKSVGGCHYAEVGNGHCAFNRITSAYPVPDPEGGYGEVIKVSKSENPDLISNITGIAWNFPVSHKGRVSVNVKIEEKQARFILTDRWYNVCDPYVHVQSPFWFEIDKTDTGDGFAKVDIDYDTIAKYATVYINGEFAFNVNMTTECPVGISYIVMQCAADGDSNGFYIKSLEKN